MGITPGQQALINRQPDTAPSMSKDTHIVASIDLSSAQLPPGTTIQDVKGALHTVLLEFIKQYGPHNKTGGATYWIYDDPSKIQFESPREALRRLFEGRE